MKDLLRRIIGQRFINYYHLVQAVLANLIYGFPARQLHVIGVTGTDGKTTTTNLIASILKAAGFRVSFLSTINAQIGEEQLETGLHTTTPSPFLLQKLLRKMVKAGSQYAVLEVTSHALDQYRTWGINFETAVLTNVTHEHLDYHKTYEKYLAAKAKLFQNASRQPGGALILNAADQSFQYLSNYNFGGKEVLTYGAAKPAQFWADGFQENLTTTNFQVHTPDQEFAVKLNLPGRFNVFNALAAICVGFVYDISSEIITQGLAAVDRIAGRMEFFDAGQNFTAMVDFAHTPNALQELLGFLRPKVPGKLIVVFGSAGERDWTKRPLMGRAADQFADMVVLTREDNRSEKVETICQQIAVGIKHKKLNQNLFVIPDRREALRFALQKGQMGDLVVITGKGHEQSLNIDGREIPWDDRAVMREELRKVVSR